MKHYALLLVLFAALGACQPKANKTARVEATNKETPSLNDSLLIKPGKSIGTINLGGDMDSVAKRLGKPYRSDGAMGSAMQTWYNNGDTSSYQTSLLGSRNMGGTNENILHIKKILITSPQYQTADSIHTGLDLTTIQKHYNLAPTTEYKSNGRKFKVYADTEKGIGFEINPVNNTCTAVTIFKTGDAPTAGINMH